KLLRVKTTEVTYFLRIRITYGQRTLPVIW
ncbi:unnamed protein product, partial [marine sediment metagenome]